MIQRTRAAIRKWLETLLHIHDSPQRTAAAFALGVLLGFSPLLGLHTVLAISLAFIFNLNRVAVLLGCYSNLPWFIAAYYALATAVGAEITRTPIPPGFAGEIRDLFELSLFHAGFWHRLFVTMRPLLWPYAVGSMLGAVILAAIAYRVALVFVIAERQRLEEHRRRVEERRRRAEERRSRQQ